jgi:hypothetical protein
MKPSPWPLAAACFEAARRAAFSRLAGSAGSLCRAGGVCLVGLLLASGPARAANPAWLSMPAPLLPLRLPVTSTPEGAGWLLRAEAADFSAVDATPVRALSGDWARYQPREGRNHALQSARLELSAAYQRWEVAATARSDILIDGSRGAFDVVHAYKQRSTPADGSRFSVDAQQRGVVWAGLRGAHSWALGSAAAVPTWQLTAALSLLSVRRVQHTDAQGEVVYSDLAGYNFNAQTLRLDSHKDFGGGAAPNATGTGLTSDLGLLWQPSGRAFINLSVVDLASRLRLNQVATESAAMSSAVFGVDERGYLDYKPLVNGRYSSRDLRLQLARKWSLTAGWRLDGIGGGGGGRFGDGAVLGARWERVGGLDLPALWLTWPVLPGWTLQLDAESRFRSLGIGVATRHASLLLRSRSLAVGESSALGWQASLHWPF